MLKCLYFIFYLVLISVITQVLCLREIDFYENHISVSDVKLKYVDSLGAVYAIITVFNPKSVLMINTELSPLNEFSSVSIPDSPVALDADIPRHRIFVADNSGVFYVLSLDFDGEPPFILDYSIEYDNRAVEIIQLDNEEVLVAFKEGIVKFGVSNDPIEVLDSTLVCDENVNTIALEGSFVYIGCKAGLMDIVDINSINGTIDELIFDNGDFKQFHIDNGYIYAATQGNENSGLLVFSINTPREPILIASFPSPAAFGIYCADKYCFLSDTTLGIIQFDITDPSSPVRIDSFKTSGIPVNINSYYTKPLTLWVADSQGGIRVLSAEVSPRSIYDKKFLLYIASGCVFSVAAALLLYVKKKVNKKNILKLTSDIKLNKNVASGTTPIVNNKRESMDSLSTMKLTEMTVGAGINYSRESIVSGLSVSSEYSTKTKMNIDKSSQFKRKKNKLSKK